VSQQSNILNALMSGDHLTALDCFNRFGSKNASKLISNLRSRGYKIPPAKLYSENGHTFGVWQMESKEVERIAKEA